MVCRQGLVIALALTLATATANAEVSELKITKQPGLLFAPMLLMENHKLVEKHAKDAGVPDLKASWLTIMSGGANNDALLSGSVHITTSGVTNLLLLWGKTNGDVKAIIGVAGLPTSSSPATRRSRPSRTMARATASPCRRCASRSRPLRSASRW